MFRLFGFWVLGKRTGDAAPAGLAGGVSAYADEALSAGWVPPPSEIRVDSHPIAVAAEQDETDRADFLARVYLHQQC